MWIVIRVRQFKASFICHLYTYTTQISLLAVFYIHLKKEIFYYYLLDSDNIFRHHNTSIFQLNKQEFRKRCCWWCVHVDCIAMLQLQSAYMKHKKNCHLFATCSANSSIVIGHLCMILPTVYIILQYFTVLTHWYRLLYPFFTRIKFKFFWTFYGWTIHSKHTYYFLNTRDSR